MGVDFVELKVARRLPDAGFFICACAMLLAMFIAFCAGEMHERNAQAAWLVDQARNLEVQAVQDAARAKHMLNQAQTEPQTFVIRSPNAAQVSSL